MNSEKLRELHSLQDQILDALSTFVAKGNPFPFFLTGGTALVRFHLKTPHRISYDLDFFSTKEIEKADVLGITKFLKARFNVIPTVKNEEDKMFMYEIENENCSVRVDFVNDPFLQVFEPTPLKGTKLLIDPLEAIYFRKIYALLNLYLREKTLDRIKDILDLMKLDEEFIPFFDFLETFVEIWSQNFTRKISTNLILSALRDIYLLLPFRKEEVERALKKIYFNSTC